MTADRYASVRRLVEGLAFRFWRRHGGELDEWRGVAGLCYAQAAADYDPERAAFTTHVYHRVRGGLLAAWRLERRRGRRRRRLPPGLYAAEPWWEQLAANLGSDALTAAALALAAPGRTVAARRRALVDFLLAAGWSGQRVRTALLELKGALS